jgi:hypothetical protein
MLAGADVGPFSLGSASASSVRAGSDAGSSRRPPRARSAR